MINHPCLNIKLIVKIFEQIKNGKFVNAPTDSGSERGKELFRNVVKYNWDSMPETIFRYSANINYSKIKQSKAPYWVLDSLLLVPDPRKIDEMELENIVKQVLDFDSIEKLNSFLDKYKGKIYYYSDTIWNEKAK